MSFIAAFIFSMAVLAATLLYAWKHPKNRLAALAAGTFIMLVAMAFPFGMSDSPGGLITNIFLTLVKTTQVFTLDASFDAEVGLVNASETFAWVYCACLAFLYLAAPILTAGFLMSFSRRARNWFKWRFNRKEEVWIFSEPSEKALLFAESVLQDGREDVCVVFCDANGENDDRIAEIGAIAVKKKIDELGENYFNRRPATLLFMAEDEERSLEQTLSFVQKRKDAVRRPTLLYCFTSRPEAGLMLNAIDAQSGGRLRFRRIAENRAVVYQELLQVGAALNAEKPEEGKTLHFLIVGCGWIGAEILKALLWCFVRYNLVIDVIDKADAQERFYRSCPGLDRDGGESYRINFLPGGDIRAFDISKIADAGDIRHAFVALGSDLLNLECAVSLRQAFRRLHRQETPEGPLDKPEIHVVINNPSNRNLNLIDHGIPYCIEPFIGGQNFYTTKTLLDYELEKQALIDHLGWQLYYASSDAAGENSKNQINEFVHNELKDGGLALKNHAQWRALVLRNDLISDFYKLDYDAWSSRARAVFDQCDKPFEHSAAIEHKRWVMYMLTEGYQYGQKTDHVAKLHRDIGRKIDELDERDVKYQELLAAMTQNNGRV